MRGRLPNMFRQHRSDPDQTTTESLRDRLDAFASSGRAVPQRDERPVRGRLAASASLGLRSRLAQPALSTPRA
jgi:hypothetical protein